MSPAFDFRDQIAGDDWDIAKGFLIEQLDQLYAFLNVPSIPDNGSTAPPPVVAPPPESIDPLWGLLSYTTGAATSSVTVTGLDLQTDLAYRFFIQTGLTSAADYLSVQPNAEAVAVNTVAIWYVTQAGVNAAYGNAAQTSWDLTGTITGRGFSGELTMQAGINHKPHGDFRLTADDSIGAINSYVGSVWRNNVNNITSMRFFLHGGKTCDWRIWCAKPTRP